MKTILFLCSLFVTATVLSQVPNGNDSSKHSVDSLSNRISELERKIKDQQDAKKDAEKEIQRATNDVYTEQFKNHYQAIQIGIESGSQIELIVPNTLRLLAIKDLSETIASINNPTSNSVGHPFNEMVIESASSHLLPNFSTEVAADNAKQKFKRTLLAIFKGPLVQGVLNSNPISGMINAAIQQAGFFEKEREIQIELTKNQIKGVSNSSPFITSIKAANFDGPASSEKEMEAFNSDLHDRIEFYSAMEQYANAEKEKSEQLYVDAKLIRKAVKASKTEICRLLSIDVNNASLEFNEKFNDRLSIDTIKKHLKDPKFKKALTLSDYAMEQLPEVKAFQATVNSSIVSYIDGYITILNKYKNNKAARLDPEQVQKQVLKLEDIKARFKDPM